MIILDTQAIAWLVAAPENLSSTARRAIAEARKEQGIAISDKTLWELAMMVSRKQIETTLTMHGFLREVEQVCTVFPIDSAIAAHSMSFGPRFPRDPADRIIAATAIVRGLPLVTSDKAIRKSGEVPCIW